MKKVYMSQLEVISKRVKLQDSEQEYFSGNLNCPNSVFNVFKNIFTNSCVELFVVIHLKTNNMPTAYEIVSKGILNSSLVHPREVFKSAILQNAASVILAHNHPSGNPEPSSEDIVMTKQVIEAGKILGIPVQDHIIFADERYYSMAENGLI